MANWTDIWRSLRAHARRNSLTSLGLFWGSLLLTYLMAVQNGVVRHFEAEINSSGPKIIYMGPGSVLKNRVGERGSRSVELEIDDAVRVLSLDSVEAISPNVEIWSQVVRAGRRTHLLQVAGVGAEAERLRNFEPVRGRFLSRLDVERAARVAYLGEAAARALFGGASAVGSSIQIGDLRFRVIGVNRLRGEQLLGSGSRDDMLVVIPYTTALRWLAQSDQIQEFVFAPKLRELGWRSIWQARQVLGPHHDFAAHQETALWFFDSFTILRLLRGVMSALNVFLFGSGLITLAVGAVGVANIMLVAVGERRQEIGLRRAVGAPRRAIFAQFLAEAAALGILAGALGTAAGLVLIRLTSAFQLLPHEPQLVPLQLAWIWLGLAAVTIAAGVAPALRATRVAPAEALRSR